MYSPTIAPTKARVDVIFNDENRKGMAEGNLSFQNIWSWEAFSSRISSNTRGSTVFSPTDILTSVGKKVIRTDTATTDAACETPLGGGMREKKTTKSGAYTMMGIVWTRMATG